LLYPRALVGARRRFLLSGRCSFERYGGVASLFVDWKGVAVWGARIPLEVLCHPCSQSQLTIFVLTEMESPRYSFEICLGSLLSMSTNPDSFQKTGKPFNLTAFAPDLELVPLTGIPPVR